jgi:phage terminase large subunit-like protein
VIYGAKEEDDWTDPMVWKKANPSLGITVGMDKVKAACESAKQNPAEENSFRQLRLNQWVKQAVRWMSMAKWDACAFPVDADSLSGRVCYGGRMKRTNTACFHFSGCRKKISTCVCGVTMCNTTYGKSKGIF